MNPTLALPALTFLFSITLALAAARDLLTRIVPDRLAIAALVLALVFRGLAGEIAPSLICAAVWLGFALVLFLLGWMGGGDAKLLPGAALMVPPTIPGQMGLVLAIGIFGGLLGIFYGGAQLLARYRHRRRGGGFTGPARGRSLLARWAMVEHWRLRRSRLIPYAVAIAGGTLWALWL